MAAVHDDAVEIAPELRDLRRALHREPEIGNDLPRTQEKVLAALDGLPFERVTLGQQLSSVTAVLRGGRPGPTVLLRGDMDALPVTELTGVPYASKIDGAMHACGHDLHTAMLVGAARLLSARQAELPGSVVFMFQPGEEGFAGARMMIEEGVLEASGERAAAAYGLHVSSSELPGGLFAGRPGAQLAAADQLEVTVRGRGGHASRPSLAADPIPVACEIVTALQTLVTRRFDVFDPVVITVGSFHAGTADNIIPASAELKATIRPDAVSTPSSIMCPAPSQPSSPGWNMNTTSPGRSACRAASSLAAPTSPAVCRSWPHACMAPSIREVNSAPVRSVTGRPSMSPRRSTTGPPGSVPPPRRTAVTEDSDVPVLISSGSPSSAASTFSWVRGRCRPISGSWCNARRRTASSPWSSCASSLSVIPIPS